jgi:hypothetical protein
MIHSAAVDDEMNDSVEVELAGDCGGDRGQFEFMMGIECWLNDPVTAGMTDVQAGREGFTSGAVE